MSRQFHISQILSITTGVLLCTKSVCPEFDYPMSGIYDILNYMSGDDLQTLALPRVADEAKPYLVRQFPWVEKAETQLPDFEYVPRDQRDQACSKYIQAMADQFGELHMVIPMNENDHEHLSPLEDVLRINPDFNPDNLIEFKPDEKEPPSPTGDINWKAE